MEDTGRSAHAAARRVESRNEAEGRNMVMRLGRSIGQVAVRGLGFVLALACGSMAAGKARGQGPAPASGMTLDGLLRMSPAQLNAIYSQGAAVALPPGRVRGTALLAPGTWRAADVARAPTHVAREDASSPTAPRPSIASSGSG